MNCDQTRDLLLLHVAGELDPGESRRVEAHLRHCTECAAASASLVDTERRVAAALRTTATAPPRLALRVMDEVAELTERRSRWRTPTRHLRRAALLAGAAASLLLAGYWLGERSRSDLASPAIVAADRPEVSLAFLGGDHLRYLANPAPAQAPGPNPAAVARELTPQLRFPVAAINLETEGARLLGGRECAAHGVPIAFLLYDWQGERVSLYQLDERRLALPALQPVSFRGRRFLTAERDGLTYVAWRSGAMSFVIVGGAPPERLLPLACTASGLSSLPGSPG